MINARPPFAPISHKRKKRLPSEENTRFVNASVNAFVKVVVWVRHWGEANVVRGRSKIVWADCFTVGVKQRVPHFSSQACVCVLCA